MSLRVIEGTWEEIERHKPELMGHRFRLIPLSDTEILRKPSAPANKAMASKPSHRVSAMGKYAGILSSEEFMRRKQEEIDIEDRSRR